MRALVAWLSLAALLAGMAAAGCGPPPPKLSPQAEKFKKLVAQTIEQRINELKPLLKDEQTQPGSQPGVAWQKAVGEIYKKASQEGHALLYNLVLMDSKAVVQAWWGPAKVKGGPLFEGALGEDYSHYKNLVPVFKDKRKSGFEVYSTNNHEFVVCAPIEHESKLLGAMCLGFTSQALEKEYGLGKKGFESINFNE